MTDPLLITDTTAEIIDPACINSHHEDEEPALSKLNHLLYLQDTIRIECKSIMELQSKTEDPGKYMEHQALLNALFIQHMDLGLKATGILASEGLRPMTVPDMESSTDDPIEFSARTTITRTCS
jgi:hypothetical protein